MDLLHDCEKYTLIVDKESEKLAHKFAKRHSKWFKPIKIAQGNSKCSLVTFVPNCSREEMTSDLVKIFDCSRHGFSAYYVRERRK